MDYEILPCRACGAKNRVPVSRLHDKPVCGRFRAPLYLRAGGRPIEVTDETFGTEVLAFKGPLLLDCWAPWCGPCKTIARIMDQLAEEYRGRVKITKINVDENPRISSQYGIRSIPTMLFFKEGKIVDQLVGALPKEEIERRIRDVF